MLSIGGTAAEARAQFDPFQMKLGDADLLAAHDLELPAGFDPRLVTAERAPRLGGMSVTTPLLATQ